MVGGQEVGWNEGASVKRDAKARRSWDEERERAGSDGMDGDEGAGEKGEPRMEMESERGYALARNMKEEERQCRE